MNDDVREKISSWRWRMVKSAGSVRAFCEAHGLNQPSVSLWMSGRVNPFPHNVDKVEAALRKDGV